MKLGLWKGMGNRNIGKTAVKSVKHLDNRIKTNLKRGKSTVERVKDS